MTATVPSPSGTAAEQDKEKSSSERSGSEPPNPAGLKTAQRRRRPKLIGLGVALIVLGGLFGWWVDSRGESQTVLVATESIQAGKPVTASQLGTTQISGGDNATTIPEMHRNDIEGQLASSNVPEGTVLNPDQFVSSVEPDDGMSIAGVPVTAAQMPALGLKPGDTVTVVVTAGQGAAGGNDGGGDENGGDGGGDGVQQGQTWRATVASVGEPSDDGIRTVDVTLNADAAEALATAGGSGRLAIVLNPSAR